MTCREKLEREHPEKISSDYYGGCLGCPSDYHYLLDPDSCDGHGNSDDVCTKCWDREIPGTEESNIPWEQILKLIEDAAEKRDRSVSLYFNPGTGMSVSVYPWPDAEDLYEIYQKGRITANDFRANQCRYIDSRDGVMYFMDHQVSRRQLAAIPIANILWIESVVEEEE